MTLKGETGGLFAWQVESALLNVQWAMLTDVGHRREINEDSAVAAPPVFAIADGMGGHEAGEVASNCVVERLSELGGRSVGEAELVNALRGAVNDLIDTGVGAGSGTTVTGVSLLDSVHEAEIFNIGDSRVYLYRNGVLVQLTKDHSVVQELVDAGRINEDEAEVHPHSNVITRAVGLNDDPIPDLLRIEVQDGDSVLVCSDGLTKEITKYGLAHFMSQSTNPADLAQEMLTAALDNGGRDNVTLVVLRFSTPE